MSSLSHDVERLRNIKTLPQIITYFRDELGWQIETTDIEEITFEYEPAELGFNNEEVVYFKESKQIRPLVADQPWGIFWISFEKKRLPVVMLRRILAHLAIRKRQTARRGDRPAWHLHDLLFIVAYGEENDRAITLAHFWQDPQNPGNLAELKVLGWDGGDTVLHLADAHKMLTEKLRWPEDTRNINSWREQWASAFTLGHKEVIATTQELEEELARLAIAIRKRANAILSKESERGPLRFLYSVFKKTLIHDLTLEDFADVIAQTISYGLLAARLTSSSKISVQNLVEMMPATNPFLRDLLSSFLSVSGRGGNFDFDELGVQEVVELLNRANVDAVKRDFGNRTRDEDPIIHFYEHFLKAYDPKKKVQRGVFFTPQPVVSYIVRSVHGLLQTEFGLDDGLASIITWGEMAERNKGLEIPKDTKPEDHFVTILDPATGTATFLVEVIDVIFRFLKEKWKKQGIAEPQKHSLWNSYVSKHLLPRLFGYEIMMAPYVIAHLKIGIKLSETGYKFESDERARIYLTNALEPPIEQIRMENIIPALAHEAQAVNEIKRKQRFTVVIGNPPYSKSSQNQGTWIGGLMEEYKRTVRTGETQIQALSDDYVKFLRLGHFSLEQTRTGVFGFITNNGYLDGPLFRDMRASLFRLFHGIRILNLYGDSRKRFLPPDGKADKNIFDIQQGVVISAGWIGPVSRDSCGVTYTELWGTREERYQELLRSSTLHDEGVRLQPDSPLYLFIPISKALEDEFNAGWHLYDVFGTGNREIDNHESYGAGFVTQQDKFAIGFSAGDLANNISQFLNSDVSDETLRNRFEFCTTNQWDFARAKQELKGIDAAKLMRRCLYRPFDCRYTVLDRNVCTILRKRITTQFDTPNLGLLATRRVTRLPFNNVFVTKHCAEYKVASHDRNTIVFPLWIRDNEDNANSSLFAGNLRLNLNPKFLKALWERLGDVGSKEIWLKKQGPEQIFQFAYSVFHSAAYRTRYAEFLKIDFPRLPLPGTRDLFQVLANLGCELVDLHLMESPKLDHFITTYTGPKSPVVDRVSWSVDTVWLNAAAKKSQPETPSSIGFHSVPEAVWNFHIGGYQVCEKWLKDRKGRTLSKDDIIHYQKIVVALNETIRLMKEIDEVIERHGGWPGAFI